MPAVAASSPVFVARRELHCTRGTRSRPAFRATPPRASSDDSVSPESTETESVQVWAGGSSGEIRAPGTVQLRVLENRWNSCDPMDMETRWQITNTLWHMERTRVGLSSERWKLGWSSAKTYVGICYFWGDEGHEKGEVFLSKYLMLDFEFENVIGCIRHELAHALTGPGDLNHGPAWRNICKAMETPKNWAGDTAINFFYRPKVMAVWTAYDLSVMTKTSKYELPPELFEKTVWPGDGTRTVFTDEQGNVVM